MRFVHWLELFVVRCYGFFPKTRLRRSAVGQRSRQTRSTKNRRYTAEALESRVLLTTFTVDDSGGADFTTIQAAVNSASAGDIINVHDGTYNETVNLNLMGSAIAGSPGDLVIQAVNSRQAFWNDAGAALTANGIGGIYTISGFDMGTATVTNVSGLVTFNDNQFDALNGQSGVSVSVTGTIDMAVHVIDSDFSSAGFNLLGAISAQMGTSAGGSLDLVVDQNNFTGLQQDGISVNNLDQTALGAGTLTARITDNTFSGRTSGGDEIGMFLGGNNSNGFFASVLIDGNQTNIGSTPSSIEDAISLDIDGTNTTAYVAITNNTLNHHDDGMFLDADSTFISGLYNVWIDGNTLDDISAEGIHLRPFSDPAGDPAVWNFLVTGNTLTDINSDLSTGHAGIEIEVDNTGNDEYTLNLDLNGNSVSMASGSPSSSYVVDANSTSNAVINIERDIASNNTGTVSIDDPGGIVTIPSANAVTDGNEVRTVSGFVFNDSNNDGDQTGEAGVGGVIVTLTGTQSIGGSISLTTYTDINGNYAFPAVVQPDGSGYTLTVGTTTDLPNYTTQDAVGDTIDSDVDDTTGQFTVTYTGSGAAIDVDAGLTAMVADTTPPNVTVNIVDASLNDNDNSSQVTFEFSETISGFTAGDLLVVGGTISAFTMVDGDSYTATFTATDGIQQIGSVTVNANSYQDLAGNLGTTGNDTVNIDTENPTVTVNILDASLNDGDNSSDVVFEFSETVSGFTAGDLTVVGGAISNLLFVDLRTYTATFTATDGIDQTGSVTVIASSYTDAVGNLGATGSDTVDIDTLNPTPVITTAESNPTTTTPFDVTIDFGETVTGFVSGDIAVGNGSVTNLSDDGGGMFTATIAPAGNGTVTVDINANVATDAVGNDSAAATQFSIEFIDSTAPVIAGTISADAFVISMDGSDLVVVQNMIEIFRESGATSLIINGGDGDDVFTVDYSSGIVTIPITINGEGNASTNPGDELVITGGAFTTAIVNYNNANDGDLSLDGNTITYTGLEPIDMTGSTATDIVLNLPDGFDNDATLQNNTAAGSIEFISNTGTFEDTTFPNPTGSLTINGGAMADTISVEGLDAAFDADLNIVATDAADSVTFQTNATALGTGSLDVMTTAITVDAAVSTTVAGAISLTASETIVVSTTGSLATVNGDVTLSANVGGGTVGDFTAVTINGGSVSTSGSGVITVTGVGASTGATSGNHGVHVLNGGVIEATGTGTVSVNGTGGNGANNNVGVLVDSAGSAIQSGSGGLVVDGTGGNGSGQDNQGVIVRNAGTITSTATIPPGGQPAVRITGRGGTGTAIEVGVNISAATVFAVGGGVEVIGFGGTGTGNQQFGVILQNAATVTDTGGGDVTVTGTGGNGVTLNAGISLVRDSTIGLTTGTVGQVTVMGTGGNGTGTLNNGVEVVGDGGPGSAIVGGTAGVIVTGIGGTGADGNNGVFVTNSGSVITAAGGGVTVTGTANGSGLINNGVYLNDGGSITDTGGGLVSVTGTGADGTSSNTGVLVSSATSSISSTAAGGDVTIIGTGGNGSGSSNTGVLVEFDATITAADVVTVTGTGGSGGTSVSDGVIVNLGGSISGITVNVTGTGGDGSGQQNRGVFVAQGGTIESTTGAVTVIGTGGTGTRLNQGVLVLQDRNGDGTGAFGAIRSAGGTISVTGLGGAGNNSYGVWIDSNAVIENTATGTVTVRGDVTDAATSQGVLISSNGVISTTDGDLTITTDYTTTADTSAEAPDLGADGIGLLSVTGTAQVTAGGTGDVIVTAADLNVVTTANITADADTVFLVNSTAGRTIGLASGTGDFSITDAEADRITADLLEIGSANAGNINVSGTFSPTLVNNLRLVNEVASAAITSPTGLAATAITVGGLELVGNLAPGDGTPGGLIAIADVTLDSTITFMVDIDGPTVGTEYDSIDVVGTVSLGDATLEVDQLMSFDPAIGTEFMIVGNDGGDAVIDTFNGLAEGDVFASAAGTLFQISYVGGDGNDVVLTALGAAGGTFEVDNLGDQIDGDYSDGELTLREAIQLANLASDMNTITFDPDLFLGGPVDIDMEPQPSGNLRMEIFEDVDIVGPGTDLLTIDANFLSQIFYIDSATVSISDLTLEEGFADGFDNGTFLETIIPVPVFLSNSERGGAIFNQEGDLTLTNVTVVDSESLDSGGGVYNLGTLTVIDSEFRTNFGGDDGGAIYNATTDFVTGVLDVSGSLFIANETFFDDGGAIHNSEGDITVDTSSFIDNFANFGGGGLSTDGGSAFVSNSTFGGNRAFVDGGAIYHSDSDLVLVNVTISGNQASVDGGGIYNDDGTLTIVNSTIFGNRADDDGDGGGIETGGGIWTFDDGNTFTTLVNTIVVGNMTGAVGSGVPDDVNEKDLEADSANNIIGDASTSGGLIDGVDGNIVGVFATDVIDTNLQNNGGPTSTHALFLGSPAIDAGDTDRATDDGTDMGTALVFDQRRTGFDRVIGNAVDIGAFELQTFAEVTIADMSATEGNSGTTAITFTLTRSANTIGTTTVDYAITNDTTETDDFNGSTLPSGTATFADGETTTTITVLVTGETTVELDETFFVTLSNPTAGSTITDDEATGTITNDDAAAISIDDVTQDEDAGTMTFTISLTNPVDTDVSVDFATATDTADGSDFTANSGTAMITAGTTSTTFTVDITADTTIELDEQFFVNLSNLQATGRDVTIGDDQGIGTITNDDAATVSINDVTQDEDTGTMTFTLTLSQQVDADVSIEYATTINTAGSSDFTDTSGMATITAGTTSTTITVDITADSIVELDEEFFVNLTNVTASGRDVTFADSQGVGTIQNDDSASVAINDVMQDEDTGTMTFTVSLTEPVDVDVTVDFATADGTATTAGSDYTTATGTATITAGTTSTTITIDIAVDTIVELDETFQVLLSNLQATGRDVTLADGIGVGTIQNDDAANVTISDPMQNEDNGTIGFVITLSQPVDTDVTVDFSTATDSAVNSDFGPSAGVVNFPAGVTAVTLVINVGVDNIVELDEQFFVNLSNLQSSGRDVTLADDQGVGTILDDDAATVSIDDVSQNEDAGTMTFTVTLSAPVDTDVMIAFATTANTAQVSDFTDTSGTVTISAGTTSATLTVAITAESIVELDEQFLVNLSNLDAGGRAVSITDSQAIGTIQSDDLASLSIGDATVIERAAGSQLVTFTVTLDNAVDTTVFVDFTTADGTATTANNDYTATSGTLEFAGTAGETRTLTVSVFGDISFEDDESFLVNLLNLQASGRNVTLGDDSATGTIINDDLIAGLATFDDQPVMPSVINADFEILVSGNYDGTPTASEVQDDLFFWNPTTGANRIVFRDGSVQDSPVDSSAINADFTDVLSGDFDENGSSDLFFWNPATGANRLVHFAGGTGSVATTFETNVVPAAAINDNDFPEAVVGNFDGAGPDDLFFWNPTSGHNRLVHFETVAAGSDTDLNNFQTNVIDTTAINGNDFQDVFVGEFVDGGVDELFFLNKATGANRRIEFAALTSGVTSGVGSIENGSLGSQAGFNGFEDRIVQIVDLNGDGLDDVFLWDPTTGANRTALTDIRDQASPRFVDDVVDPTLINGGSFEQLQRLVDTAFTPGEGEDLYFWDPITGNNRRITL